MKRMTRRIATAISLQLTSASLWAGTELQGLQVNRHYSVAARTSQSLEIRDIEARTVWEFSQEAAIEEWELIPDGRLLAYTRASGDGGKSCLLDLSTRVHACAKEFSREPDEKAWSPAGKFFVWKSPGSTQLLIAAAETVHLSKEGVMPSSQLTVQGHPLGLIWQVSWLSETQLLVATGVGEGLSLAVLDLEQKDLFYLVGTDERASMPREIQESKLDIEGWLIREGFLSSRAQWRRVQADIFPWIQAY